MNAKGNCSFPRSSPNHSEMSGLLQFSSSCCCLWNRTAKYRKTTWSLFLQIRRFLHAVFQRDAMAGRAIRRRGQEIPPQPTLWHTRCVSGRVCALVVERCVLAWWGWDQKSMERGEEGKREGERHSCGVWGMWAADQVCYWVTVGCCFSLQYYAFFSFFFCCCEDQGWRCVQ